jgi:hypothetical protein
MWTERDEKLSLVGCADPIGFESTGANSVVVSRWGVSSRPSGQAAGLTNEVPLHGNVVYLYHKFTTAHQHMNVGL